MKSLWILFTLFFAFSFSAYSDSFDDIEKLMKERERMFESLMKGMFSDDPIEDSFFNGMSLLGEVNSSANIEMSWKDTDKGRRLEIIPKNDKSPINIDINKDRISLSGKVVNEESDANGNIISKTSSSFSQSVSVPQNLDGDKAEIKQEGNKIVVDFPFKKDIPTKKAKKENKGNILKPIDPSPEDVI